MAGRQWLATVLTDHRALAGWGGGGGLGSNHCVHPLSVPVAVAEEVAVPVAVCDAVPVGVAVLVSLEVAVPLAVAEAVSEAEDVLVLVLVSDATLVPLPTCSLATALATGLVSIAGNCSLACR